MIDPDTYVKSSRILVDRGEKIGLEPRFLSFRDLELLGHPKRPIENIRAKCIDCCGGSLGEVRKCPIFRCPLWPMRLGSNPFHAKSQHSKNKDVSPKELSKW